jgi:hypothetical protein
MWSEQPNPIKAMRGPEVAEPEPQVIVLPDAIIHQSFGSLGGTIASAPSLSGVSSAIVFFTCIGGVGDPQVPAGWTLLESGATGGSGGDWRPYMWAVAKIDKVSGTEGLSFGWADSGPGGYKYLNAHAMYLRGGVGGRWSHSVKQVSGPAWTISQMTFDAPPVADVYLQAMTMRNGRPHSVPAGASSGTAAPLAGMCWKPAYGSWTPGTLPPPLSSSEVYQFNTYDGSTGGNGAALTAWWSQ